MKEILDYASTVRDIRQERKVLHKMMEDFVWDRIALRKKQTKSRQFPSYLMI